MALFDKKKTADAPAAGSVTVAARADTSGDTSTVVDDFSDFSADALQAASTPADNGTANGQGKRVKAPKAARADKKPSAPRGLKNGVFIGLNIGSDSIKVIEASAKNGALSITGMGMVPTPSDSISNGVVMSVNALAGAIKDAMNQAGIKSKKVVTSVSGTGALVVRIIEVPKMSDGELEDNMKMDADRYIPFPPSEVIMDFKALRELPSDPDAMNMEVLLAAAQREIIDLHIQVLQDAKLDPRAIDVEPLAAARALTNPLTTGTDINAEPDYNDVAAILNIGASGTEISILRGDILVFTRTVPAGGNALTQAITDTLGLAWHDAENLKREMGDALAPNESTPSDATQMAGAGFGDGDFNNAPPMNAGASDDWSEFDSGADATNADANTTDALSNEAAVGLEPQLESGFDTAPASTDPFDDTFFDQGPQGAPQDLPQNAEPGEQHQQKETEGGAEDDADAKTLPSREGELASTEALSGVLQADSLESNVLPTKDTNTGGETVIPENLESVAEPLTAASTPEAAPRATSTQNTAAETAAGMPVELRALFNFAEVEDPDEELPTADEDKPADFNSLLGDEDDDFSDLPTLTSDAPTAAPMASAFDFPISAPAASAAGTPAPPLLDEDDQTLPARAGIAGSAEAVSGTTAIDADEASLLPSEVAGGSSAVNVFGFQNDPFATTPVEAPIAETSVSDFNFDVASQPPITTGPVSTTAVPAPADDPFAAFDLSGAAPGAVTGAAPQAAITETAFPTPVAASTSAADDFDLDSLFGGLPTTPVAAPASSMAGDMAGTMASDAGMNVLDILGDDMLSGDLGGGLGSGLGDADFGDDFSSFGAGLGGANAGEIDAQTLHSIVGPTLDNLIAEVRRSLEYHTTRYPDAAVRRITLVGGGAKLKNLDAYFTQSLGIPTSVGNPLARLPIQAPKLPPGYADENGPLFAVALGLAMRELMR